MNVVHIDRDVLYLPKPNEIEVVLSNIECPRDLTRTAFVVPVFEDGTVMMANNARRKIEIAGGHVDPWETLMEGASRECMEEVGCVVTEMTPIGFLRMTMFGEKPEGYGYPFPVSYQQFYAARVLEVHPYEVNDECLLPERKTLEELEGHRRTSIKHFVGAAIALFA